MTENVRGNTPHVVVIVTCIGYLLSDKYCTCIKVMLFSEPTRDLFYISPTKQWRCRDVQGAPPWDAPSARGCLNSISFRVNFRHLNACCKGMRANGSFA